MAGELWQNQLSDVDLSKGFSFKVNSFRKSYFVNYETMEPNFFYMCERSSSRSHVLDQNNALDLDTPNATTHPLFTGRSLLDV